MAIVNYQYIKCAFKNDWIFPRVLDSFISIISVFSASDLSFFIHSLMDGLLGFGDIEATYCIETGCLGDCLFRMAYFMRCLGSAQTQKPRLGSNPFALGSAPTHAFYTLMHSEAEVLSSEPLPWSVHTGLGNSLWVFTICWLFACSPSRPWYFTNKGYLRNNRIFTFHHKS